MLDYKEIGNRIRLYRKKTGYTQEQLALSICSSAAYISYIERAIKKPSLQKLAQIAEVLDVSVDELISQGDPPPDLLSSLPSLMQDRTLREKKKILNNLKEIIYILERTG